ncbi:LysE family translocator [Neorhizobium galegae]|uniref:LysE family translocator n=1 Tax=Neorhizobium galegae TaxID=399 RepID=UPI001F478A07|nr:LysE family transporter [Neorhizobium galegae]UIK03556.1 LysE family transporter [Neorhizobium galegae]
MTADIWFAFAATAIFLALLPSPLACLTASFSLQRGRRTAIATVPGLAVGMSAALIVAMIPMALIAVYLPKFIDVISWAGLGYLMLYVIWSYQDPRISGPMADNDNLPECRAARIFGCLFGKSAFRARYAVVLAAVLAQFVDPDRSLLPQLLEMQATFLVCAAFGAGIHVLFPRRVLPPPAAARQPQLRLTQAPDPLHFAARGHSRLSPDRRLTFSVLPDAAP